MSIQTMIPTFINNNTYIGIVADGHENLTLKVLDVYGRMAKTIQTQIEEGMNELMVNLSDLKVGIYVVNAFSGGRFLKAIKFVKMIDSIKSVIFTFQCSVYFNIRALLLTDISFVTITSILFHFVIS